MPTYTYNLLRDELVRDEGCCLKPYVDSVGKLTLGVGRNLTDVGISQAESDILLSNDIAACEQDLDRNIPWWRTLSDARQRGILNLCFNMGWGTLSQFKNLLAALQAGDWDRAADSALHSLWASQVGSRAQRIAQIIREG